MRRYVFLTLILLLSFGCGGQDVDFNPQQTISYDKNITESINYLKREYADLYITTYVADNEEDLFVYTKAKAKEYEYSLYHYNIATSVKPKFVNTVVEQSFVKIKGVDFLPENKIVYMRASDLQFDLLVCIYDYKLKKEIERFEAPLAFSLNMNIHVNEDKCSIVLYDENQNSTIDIQYIYENYECK